MNGWQCYFCWSPIYQNTPYVDLAPENGEPHPEKRVAHVTCALLNEFTRWDVPDGSKAQLLEIFKEKIHGQQGT